MLGKTNVRQGWLQLGLRHGLAAGKCRFLLQ